MPGKYAVIGHPVAHSLSPEIHHSFGNNCGIELSYTKIDATLDNFSKAVAEFVEEGGKGLNVTIPHKQQALRLAAEASDRAKNATAANILIRKNNTWHADNTDGTGLVRHLQRLGIEAAGMEILILGAGGAVWGITEPLLQEKPAHVHICNRTRQKAEQITNHFSKGGNITAQQFPPQANKAYDLVINATPSGINGDGIELPEGIIKNNTTCYDLGYNREQDTPFVQWAKTKGAETTSDGLGMLIEQAAESFMLWHGITPDTTQIYQQFGR